MRQDRSRIVDSKWASIRSVSPSALFSVPSGFRCLALVR